MRLSWKSGCPAGTKPQAGSPAPHRWSVQCILAILAPQRWKQEDQKFNVELSSIASLGYLKPCLMVPHPHPWNLCLCPLGNVITVYTMYIGDLLFVSHRDEPN